MRPSTSLTATLTIFTILFAVPAEGARCTRVIQNKGSEYLVNTCNTCQKVNIRRKRRGIAMPIMRTYNIQARSKFLTPFKGVGRSRITSEILCRNIEDPNLSTRSSKFAPKPVTSCVTLKAIGTREAALINQCSGCRGAIVARYAKDGRLIDNQVYNMHPLSAVSVPSKGAASLRYLTETPCLS